MPNLLVTAILFSFLATAPNARAALVIPAHRANAKLKPMPKALGELSLKIGSLWRGNRALYCDPRRSIVETVREVKLLKNIKVARFDEAKQELQFETRTGTKGALDIDPNQQVAARSGELCLRE